MKLSKKVLLVALFALLAVGLVFVGCGKGGKGSGGKVVVKAMGYGDNSNPEGQNWVRIVAAFEKENPNIDIQDELLYDEAYHQKVTARLASGDVPDVAYMGADARWGKPWAEAKQQYDMKALLDANYYDLSLIPSMGPNGEIYEIPLGTSNLCTIMFVNSKLLKELGFDIPKTYADLVKMVPAAKAKGVEVVSTHGADGWAWGSCILSGIVARTSGNAHWVASAQAGTAKFTDPEFVNALKVLQKMVKDGVLSSKSVLIDDGTNMANFNNGKVLFMLSGQWDTSKLTPEAQETTKLVAFPVLPEEKGCADSVAGAIQVGYGITQSGAKDEKVRDAAVKFLTYFYSEAETTQRLRDGSIVAPILKGYQIPADMPTITKEKAALGMNTKIITDVIDSYISGAQNDAINAGCQKIVSGSATPEQVAAEVEALRPAAAK
jgi:raffinose/stachyose/melibiose transport system substrate-binding protein